jgi:hypothetical protein
MSPARWRALAVLAAILLAVAALAVAARNREPAALPARSERPTLMLLTSLPLVFGEQFTLDGGGSPALTALERRYRVVPISTAAAAELRQAGLLLMAQSPAQLPEDLVALDRWVRGGGRVLLLADPALDWPSERPLGDALRPPPMFMDTGLLGHWGVRLDTPEERGPASRKLAGRTVETSSPGTLHGKCAIGPDRLTANCRIGKGRATIVADADLIDGLRRGDAAARNLDAVVAALAELERR